MDCPIGGAALAGGGLWYPQTRERRYLLGYRLAEEGGRAARHSAARQSTADPLRAVFLSPTSAPPEAVGVGVVMLCLHAGPQQVRQKMDVLQPWMQECQALLRDFQIDPLPLSACLLPSNSPLLQAAQELECNQQCQNNLLKLKGNLF